jgi:hypothetical protein
MKTVYISDLKQNEENYLILIKRDLVQNKNLRNSMKLFAMMKIINEKRKLKIFCCIFFHLLI